MTKPHVRDQQGFYEALAGYIADGLSPREIVEDLARRYPGTSPLAPAHVNNWLNTRSFWRLLDAKVGRKEGERLWSARQSKLRSTATGHPFTPQDYEDMLGFGEKPYQHREPAPVRQCA